MLHSFPTIFTIRMKRAKDSGLNSISLPTSFCSTNSASFQMPEKSPLKQCCHFSPVLLLILGNTYKLPPFSPPSNPFSKSTSCLRPSYQIQLKYSQSTWHCLFSLYPIILALSSFLFITFTTINTENCNLLGTGDLFFMLLYNVMYTNNIITTNKTDTFLWKTTMSRQSLPKQSLNCLI